MIPFIYNDGGRSAAGFKNKQGVGDCVARAIAITSGRPYLEVYNMLAEGNATQKVSKRERTLEARTGKKTAQHGIFTKRQWFVNYMHSLGFTWVATMTIGSGCNVHLRRNELPKGRIIAKLSKHYAAVIDGALYDTYDCSRDGTRCVYGYWIYDKDEKHGTKYAPTGYARALL